MPQKKRTNRTVKDPFPRTEGGPVIMLPNDPNQMHSQMHNPMHNQMNYMGQQIPQNINPGWPMSSINPMQQYPMHSFGPTIHPMQQMQASYQQLPYGHINPIQNAIWNWHRVAQTMPVYPSPTAFANPYLSPISQINPYAAPMTSAWGYIPTGIW